MTDSAIRISGISKCHQLYESPGDRLKQFVIPRLYSLLSIFRKISPASLIHLPTYYKEFWALKDVSFEIKKGETVGIVGRNGSGKSTLLQVIAGTVSPTVGTVETHGRVAALLELGSGFNPEFTGRDNVFMNAAILGLSQEEVTKRFEEIADFADIGAFMEQPIKTYSSGMIVRLAFAVAINVAPDILIIDEALSVGDELFQRKCFSRIEVMRANGTTILFVSHSNSAIVELCDRAILMDAGEKLASGEPKYIVGLYQKLLYAPTDKSNLIRNQICSTDKLFNGEIDGINNLQNLNSNNSEQEIFDPSLVPVSTISYESSYAQIESPGIFALNGESVNNLLSGNSYLFVYNVHFYEYVNNVSFGMLLKTVSGVELGGGKSAKSLEHRLMNVMPGECYQVKFRFHCALNQGIYFLNAGVVGKNENIDGYLHRLLDCVCIRVINNSNEFANGNVDFDILPEFKKINLISQDKKQEILI